MIRFAQLQLLYRSRWRPSVGEVALPVSSDSRNVQRVGRASL